MFTYFHCILFFDRFSISPMPSNTFVMSYIRRFCLTASVSAACKVSNTNLRINKTPVFYFEKLVAFTTMNPSQLNCRSE